MRRHSLGPMRVLKGHRPEGPAVWHQTLVHPPGGVVGGDHIHIELKARLHAHVVLTTPSSTKWYRSAGPQATQQIDIEVADGACVEWLPQDNIVFRGANALWHNRFRVQGEGSLIAADLCALGRPGAGEDFDAGHLRWSTELSHEDRPVFIEQGRLDGADSRWRGPAGLAGHVLFGSLIAFRAHWSRDEQAAREAVAACRAATRECAVTLLSGLVVCRWRGDRADLGWRQLRAAWASLRPHLNGQNAVAPRIWNT